MRQRIALVVQHAHRERRVECVPRGRRFLQPAGQDEDGRVIGKDVDRKKLHREQQRRVHADDYRRASLAHFERVIAVS